MRIYLSIPRSFLPYRVLVFLMVSLFGLSRCNLEGGSNNEPEETPYDYSSLVAMHPDTLTRPNLQWISSYRLPSNQYGFHLAFDGSDSTYWSTAPGLNHLEGFEWQFNRPQNLGQICIKTVQSNMFAQLNRVLVLTDRGQIEGLPNLFFPIPDSIRWIKVVYLIDQNWSRVALPLNNSAFSSLVRIRKGLSVLFESKPLGTTEIQIKNQNGKFAPCISTDGFVRITEQPRAEERFDLNDGRRHSRLLFNGLVPERRIFFQFPDLRPVLGFRIHSDSSPAACLQLSWHKPNGSTELFQVNSGLWEHIFKSDTLATKNISFTLRLLEGQKMALTEFDFWDGARWYRVQEDSLQRKLDLNKLTMNIPAQWPVNKSILFDEWFSKNTAGAADWETERDASGAVASGQQVQALFRANGLFELLWYFKMNGEESLAYTLFSGNWKWNQGQLELSGTLWSKNGVFEKTAVYTPNGNRMIPQSREFPEFEFSY